MEPVHVVSDLVLMISGHGNYRKTVFDAILNLRA